MGARCSCLVESREGMQRTPCFAALRELGPPTRLLAILPPLQPRPLLPRQEPGSARPCRQGRLRSSRVHQVSVARHLCGQPCSPLTSNQAMAVRRAQPDTSVAPSTPLGRSLHTGLVACTRLHAALGLTAAARSPLFRQDASSGHPLDCSDLCHILNAQPEHVTCVQWDGQSKGCPHAHLYTGIFATDMATRSWAEQGNVARTHRKHNAP